MQESRRRQDWEGHQDRATLERDCCSTPPAPASALPRSPLSPLSWRSPLSPWPQPPSSCLHSPRESPWGAAGTCPNLKVCIVAFARHEATGGANKRGGHSERRVSARARERESGERGGGDVFVRVCVRVRACVRAWERTGVHTSVSASCRHTSSDLLKAHVPAYILCTACVHTRVEHRIQKSQHMSEANYRASSTAAN